MKFLNRFIIILSSLLIISLGSAKAETLEEIAQELNDLKESISNLGTSEVKEVIVIDKALNEITKAVEFVNDKVNTGDIEAAVATLNYVDKTMSDIATSTIPKEFETEVVKKGEDFSPEKMSEITDITNNLTASQKTKKQKLVQDMVEANINGLDTIAMSNTLNEIGIKTINSDYIAEAISQAEQIRERGNSGQALRKALDISKELKDQERYGAIIGTSAGEVDLALRQVEVIREGDPRKYRALEIEKYGKSLGLSVDSVNKGIQAVYSGDIETEKQVTLEIINAMKKSPDWEVSIEIDDAVMNDLMSRAIAQENVVYAIMNNNELGFLDTSAFRDGVVVNDVYGYVDAQKEHKLTISEFANEIGNYLESVGSYDSGTIRDVKYQINRGYSVSGLSSKTVAAKVMAELEGHEYKDAYYAIDRSWYDFEARGSQTLAYSAAKVEAIMMNDRYAHTTATYSDDYAIKLTDSQKAQVSRVYDNALEQIKKENASIALEEVKRTTQMVTETAFQLTPKIDSLEEKVENLASDKDYLTLKEEVEKKVKIKENLNKDLVEGKINYAEFMFKAGKIPFDVVKYAKLQRLQSEIDAVKKTLSATKNSLANAKNNMNKATQNAAIAGVSIETISQVVSLTAEKASVVAAKAAQQAAIQAAETAAITSQKLAEQAAAKAAEAATTKAAEEVSAAAATKAAEQAKAAAKVAEQAAAKASQAAQVAATKAAQQAADAAAKASQRAAEAAAKQAANAAAVAAKEEAQQAAKQAAAISAKTAATEAAKKAAAAAQQAAQQAKEAAAQAAQAATSEVAEAAATSAKQAAQQAAQQLATAAIEAAKQQVADNAAAASVAAYATVKETAKIAQQKAHNLDPDIAALESDIDRLGSEVIDSYKELAYANQKAAQDAQAAAKEAVEKAKQAAATATAAQEAEQGIASISKEALSEAQKAAKEAVEVATIKAAEEVVEQAKAEITKDAKDAARDAAIAAAKEVTGDLRWTEETKELQAEIQAHMQDIYKETGIGMSSSDPNYEKVNGEFSKKSWEEKKAVFDKLDELEKAKHQAQHG